jgi:hypothetical protein
VQDYGYPEYKLAQQRNAKKENSRKVGTRRLWHQESESMREDSEIGGEGGCDGSR